jgi:hypothetical protein
VNKFIVSSRNLSIDWTLGFSYFWQIPDPPTLSGASHRELCFLVDDELLVTIRISPRLDTFLHGTGTFPAKSSTSLCGMNQMSGCGDASRAEVRWQSSAILSV